MLKNYQVYLTVRSSRLAREIIRPLSLYVSVKEYKNFSEYLNLPPKCSPELQKVCEQIAYKDLKEQISSIPTLNDLQQPFIFLVVDTGNRPSIFVPKHKFEQDPLFYINESLKEFGTVYFKNQSKPRFEVLDIIFETSD